MVTARHQAKKEEILQHGIELLWTMGYNGTSVKDIVEAAGIPKGSFYAYFDSKEDFAREAMNGLLQIAFDKFGPTLSNPALTPMEKIQAFYAKRIEVATDEFGYKRGCMISNLGGEVANSSEYLRKIVQQAWEDQKKPIVQVVQEAIDTGQLSEAHNAQELTEFLENAFRGAMTSAITSRSAKPFEVFRKYLKQVLQ